MHLHTVSIRNNVLELACHVPNTSLSSEASWGGPGRSLLFSDSPL